MAPLGSHLLAAGMTASVNGIVHALNNQLGFQRCRPSEKFTNGILLDLYRISKGDRERTVGLPVRLAELMHGLGYIEIADLSVDFLFNRSVDFLFPLSVGFLFTLSIHLDTAASVTSASTTVMRRCP
jgi:hypothetical protein